MISKLILFPLLIGAILSDSPDADLVVFPGWPAYTFKTYSGMLSIASGAR